VANEGPNIQWSGNLSGNIQTLGLRTKARMVATAKYVAPQIQSDMRANAPWEDQTGNARNGLFSVVQVSTNEVAIVLYHSVPYGIWLELRWSGKYAIITPSLAKWGPRFFALLAKAVFDEGSPG
jgi:hypothetical protein